MSKANSQSLPADRDALLRLMKQLAKKEQNDREREFEDVKHSALLNAMALTLGYANWSLLHKSVAAMSDKDFAKFSAKVHAYPQVQQFIADQSIDREAAIEEMREWVHSKYERLIEFAFYDSEAENGFAWPSVDLIEELQGQFDGTYPYDLIEEVAFEMEQDGPWGVEDYGDDAGERHPDEESAN